MHHTVVAGCTGVSLPPAPGNSAWPSNLCDGTPQDSACRANCSNGSIPSATGPPTVTCNPTPTAPSPWMRATLLAVCLRFLGTWLTRPASRPGMCVPSRPFAWGPTTLKLLRVVGLGARGLNVSASCVAKVSATSFISRLSAANSRCLGKCMPHCLRRLGGGRPWCDDLPEDAMRTFMSQNPRWVGSFINACESLALDDPPDEVVFVDRVNSDEFMDCCDEFEEMFTFLDSALEGTGFVSAPRLLRANHCNCNCYILASFCSCLLFLGQPRP